MIKNFADFNPDQIEVHKCIKCKQTKDCAEIGKQDYSENHRPFLCEKCWLDWSEYFTRHLIPNRTWRIMFEEWLYDKEIEKVMFT